MLWYFELYFFKIHSTSYRKTIKINQQQKRNVILLVFNYFLNRVANMVIRIPFVLTFHGHTYKEIRYVLFNFQTNRNVLVTIVVGVYSEESSGQVTLWSKVVQSLLLYIFTRDICLLFLTSTQRLHPWLSYWLIH